MGSKTVSFKNLKEWILSPKGSRILLAAGIIGIALIFVSSFFPAPSKQAAAAASSRTGLSEYAAQLEGKLKTMVSGISGVGKADVMVTFAGSAEYVYEQGQKTTTASTSQTQEGNVRQSTENNNQEQQPVVINGESGGQQALVKTELAPQVKGVVVVCDGGDVPRVQEDIVSAVSTVLDIPANHICVIKRSSK